MNKNSRTKNATRNAVVAMIVQILKVMIEFVIRTVFIKMLGSEYLGVNGLFTNILTILSFVELGIGNAIIFSMYKTIAQNDTEKIKSLMDLYKKSYNIIAIFVLLAGICVIPFIDFVVKETPNITENINIIYILFLLNTVFSYLFMYKKSIILAFQKGYIVDICKFVSEVLKGILQIIILLTTKNFILFLITQIVCTLIDNLLSSFIADKMFPYLKDKNIKVLEKEEKNTIFKNVKALVLYKFGSIILNGTDNIIISKMLGLKIVGIVSNFNLLINTITTIIGNALSGFTASIGNLNADEDNEKQERVFNQLYLLSTWIYGFCSIAFLVLANPFIELWIGTEYILNVSSVVAIVLHLYINGVQYPGYIYRTTIGLFTKGKYAPLIAAIINIVLSIILGKHMGLVGILLATSIARLVTTTWYDIYMVFKYKFKKSPIYFYIKYLRNFVIVVFITFVTICLMSFIKIEGLYGFIIKIVLCSIIPNIMFLLFFYNSVEFKELYKRVKIILSKNKAVN